MRKKLDKDFKLQNAKYVPKETPAATEVESEVKENTEIPPKSAPAKDTVKV